VASARRVGEVSVSARLPAPVSARDAGQYMPARRRKGQRRARSLAACSRVACSSLSSFEMGGNDPSNQWSSASRKDAPSRHAATGGRSAYAVEREVVTPQRAECAVGAAARWCQQNRRQLEGTGRSPPAFQMSVPGHAHTFACLRRRRAAGGVELVPLPPRRGACARHGMGG